MLPFMRKVSKIERLPSHLAKEPDFLCYREVQICRAAAMAGLPEPEVVELSESDIPGASLAEPLESHALPALRWWLQCRGIKVPSSMKKKQVIMRYSILVAMLQLCTVQRTHPYTIYTLILRVREAVRMAVKLLT